MNLTPAKFVFQKEAYKVVARARRTLIGVRDLGSCCKEWVIVNEPSLAASKLMAGATDKIRANVIWDIVDTAISNEITGNGPSSFTLKTYDDEIVVPTYAPLTIPGTTKGVKYKTIFVTNAGYVSYRQDVPLTSQTRIRIARDAWETSWPSTELGNGISWESINSTHLAQNSFGVEQAKILIARGLDALFKLEKF